MQILDDPARRDDDNAVVGFHHIVAAGEDDLAVADYAADEQVRHQLELLKGNVEVARVLGDDEFGRFDLAADELIQGLYL